MGLDSSGDWGQDLCWLLLVEVWCRSDPSSGQARCNFGVGDCSVMERWQPLWLCWGKS